MGIHPKVASERLGHSKVGITLDLYSHVLPGMQEDAAATMDAALRRLRNGPKKSASVIWWPIRPGLRTNGSKAVAKIVSAADGSKFKLQRFRRDNLAGVEGLRTPNPRFWRPVL